VKQVKDVSRVLTTVASFRDPWEAHLFCGRLEAEGVPATVNHEHHIWVNWPISTGLGGAKVQVPSSRAYEAQTVLAKCLEGRFTEELNNEFGNIELLHCPVCGSRKLRCRPGTAQIAFGVSLLLAFGVPSVLDKSTCRCLSCGHKWHERKP
jgi:hypothetical protein